MFWWFDCFPNRTPRKMLQFWWEGRLLSPCWECQGHNEGKKGVSYIENKSRTVVLFFFIPVATACDEFLFCCCWSVYQSAVDKIVYNGETCILFKWKLCRTISQKQTTVTLLREFATIWSSQVTLLVFLRIDQILHRCLSQRWWWHAWWKIFLFYYYFVASAKQNTLKKQLQSRSHCVLQTTATNWPSESSVRM